MDNNERDTLLVKMSGSVGRVEGKLDGITSQISHLERSKVSWRAFASIGSIFMAGMIGVGRWLFDRGV